MIARIVCGIFLACLAVGIPVQAEGAGSAESLEVITAENANRIEQIGMIGYGRVNDMAWTPDGERLTLATSVGLVAYAANQYEYEPSERWMLPEDTIFALAYHPDGSILATVSGARFLVSDEERVFRLWDVATRTILDEWTAVSVYPDTLIFSPDGSELAVHNTRWRDEATLWDVSDSTNVRTLEPTTWEDIQRAWYAPNDESSFAEWSQPVFSPDGRYAAYLESDVILVNLTTDTQVTLRQDEENELYGVQTVLFAPNSQILVGLGYLEMGGGSIHVWDVATGDILLYSHQGGVFAMGLHPTESRLVYKHAYGPDIWFWEAGREAASPIYGQDVLWQDNDYTELAFSLDGSELAVIHGGAVEFWDVYDGMKVRPNLFVRQPDNFTEPMLSSSLTYSSDGRFLAVTGGRLHPTTWRTFLFDVETLEVYGSVEGGPVQFSPDGSMIVSYGYGDPQLFRLWSVDDVLAQGDLYEGDELAEMFIFNLNGYFGTSAFFSSAAPILAVTGVGIEIWDLDAVLEQRIVGTWEDYDDSALIGRLDEYRSSGPIAFSPDGELLATRHDNCYLAVWDVAAERIVSCMGGELTLSEPFGAVVFSPDGSLLISGAEMPFYDDASLSLRVWEVATGDLLADLDGHFENYNDIAISPDGRVIATAGGGFACGECPSQDGAIRLWGVKAGGG